MMNECHFKIPPAWVDYETIKTGEWFWTHVPDPNSEINFPMFRVDGGYVSPANGYLCADTENCYRKVLRVPAGTEITIRVSTRER